MPTAVAEKFACGHCGKQFAWKPELAGKQAKCKACGNVLTVPMSLGAPAPAASKPISPAKPAAQKRAAAPPPPPAEDRTPTEDDFANYDFSEPAPPPPPAKRAAAAIAFVAPRKSAVAAEFEAMTSDANRKDRFSFWAMCDVPRDIVAPIVILVVGFGSIVAWAMSTVETGPLGIFLVTLGTAVVTLIKTAMLTFGAIYIAPRFELSFGDVRTAVLKMAAIVVFSDGVSVWLPVEMLSGMGKGMVYGVGLKAFVIAAVAGYLFDMERNEVGLFAAPMGLLSYAFGVVLTIMAATVLKDMSRKHSVAATPAAATAPSSPAAAVLNTPVTPPAALATADGDADPEPDADGKGVGKAVSATQPIADTPTPAADPLVSPGAAATTADKLSAQDRAVEAAIGVYTFVREAREFQYKGNKQTHPVAEAFYAAGAPNIYIDIRGRKNTMFGHMYVQLPTEPANRVACFALAANPAKLDGMTAEPQLKDVGQNYLVFDLPPR